MDADLCKSCQMLEMLLIENTQRGSHHKKPFRTVFVQLKCNGMVLSTERIGYPESVSDDYAMLCEPNGACSNIVTVQFLSEQMMEDYDSAVSRAFSRIDGYGETECPQHCIYDFEQKLSEMSR